MKKIIYELYQSTTEEGVDITIPKEIPWSEANERNARAEAYNGKIEITPNDGQPDPAETPTQLDIIEAQVTYTAMMTDTLLEA